MRLVRLLHPDRRLCSSVLARMMKMKSLRIPQKRVDDWMELEPGAARPRARCRAGGRELVGVRRRRGSPRCPARSRPGRPASSWSFSPSFPLLQLLRLPPRAPVLRRRGGEEAAAAVGRRRRRRGGAGVGVERAGAGRRGRKCGGRRGGAGAGDGGGAAGMRGRAVCVCLHDSREKRLSECLCLPSA